MMGNADKTPSLDPDRGTGFPAGAIDTGGMRERWQRIKAVFASAARVEQSERAEVIARLSEGDEDLRAEVESLFADEGALPEVDEAQRLWGLPSSQGLLSMERAPEEIPAQVGAYRVIRRVGEGQSGAVYEAEQPKTHRSVAVKVLRTSATSARALRRFEAEATTLARLSHPGIAQIYEAGIDTSGGEARPFIAMEMARGRPITDFALSRRLDVRGRVELMALVCDAVQHAHRRGIVHLDLKPANIMVSEEAQPKIVDFGIAHLADKTIEAAPAAADKSTIAGTVPYMSPEQFSGRTDDLDVRADVFALGIILFEVLAGGQPPDRQGKTYMDMAMEESGGEAPRLGDVVRGLRGGDLEAIVLKAAAPDRAERYESASELALDLRRYLRCEPVSAREAGALYSLRKFVCRRKGFSATTLACTLAVICAMVWVSWTGRRAMADAAVARDVVAVLLNEGVRRIADSQGTQDERRAWIEQVRPRAMELHARHPEDAEITMGTARLLILESDVEHETGHPEAALRARLEALAIRDTHMADRGRDERFLMDRSINLVKIGDIYIDRGQIETGRRYYESALAIDEELAGRPEASDEALDNLSWSYERMRRFAGSPERQRAVIKQRLGLIQRLVARNPGRALSLYARADAKLSMADLIEDPAVRLKLHRDSLADTRATLAMRPQSRTALRLYVRLLAVLLQETAGRTPNDEDEQLLYETVRAANSFVPAELRDMMIGSAVLHAKMSAAEIAMRWGERPLAVNLLGEVENSLPVFEASLAGRRDEYGVRQRAAALVERLNSTK